MIQELKYVIYSFVIFFFIFFVTKYYFSDENKKNSYRSIQLIDKNNDAFASNLFVVESDTENIIEYAESSMNQNKKTYHFWKLLIDHEK